MKKILINLVMYLIVIVIVITNNELVFAEEFGWPLSTKESNISSPMYDRTGIVKNSKGYHMGWDFGGTEREAIMASASGKVVSVTEVGTSNYGNSITIEHQLSENFVYDNVDYGKILYTRYAHMIEPSPFNNGDIIAKGTVIGGMGGTGKNQNSYDTHLHFEFLTEKTMGTSVSKEVDKSTGKGESKYEGYQDHWTRVYKVIYSTSNPLIATISPELLIDAQKNIVVSQDTNVSGDNSMVDGKMKLSKQDIEKALEISSDVIEYGKLSDLEKTAKAIKKSVKKYGKTISACLVFIATISIGFSIILKSKNAEERMLLMSGLMAVGVGALIVAFATYIVDLII